MKDGGEPVRLLSLVFDVDLVNLLYANHEGDAAMVNRCYARAGRMVAHPTGLKVAFPELHGEEYTVYLLDEPFRKDFVINKTVPADCFGLSGDPRRPRLTFMPRGWHNGMMLVHGHPNVAPVQRLCEGWPLCVPLVDAGMGWFSQGRNQDGSLKVWLDNGHKGTTVDLGASSSSDDERSLLKPWMMRVHHGELKFDSRLLLELIGGVVYLLQNEGTDKSTWDDVWGALGIMAHLGRLSPGGTTMIEPVIRRAMQLQEVHLSLDFGDHLWMGLVATLFHGIPVTLKVDCPVAIDVKADSGGGAEMVQSSPTFGGARRVWFREKDAMAHPTDAILVIEQFGGVVLFDPGSWTSRHLPGGGDLR